MNIPPPDITNIMNMIVISMIAVLSTSLIVKVGIYLYLTHAF